MTKPIIPKGAHAPIVGGRFDPRWLEFFRSLASVAVTQADVRTIVESMRVDSHTRIFPSPTTEVSGTPESGYSITLRVLPDSGSGTAIYKLTRDSFGRISGTEAADSDDLPEGTTNLYWTAARSFVPTTIPAGVTYSVPANCQALFTLPIELESGASLDVAGALVEVS